ncbi:MAG: hypothetical protein F4152_05140 [Dehalococcoidia bacterium]|nr:hypothetical protein [Dehalococcoidia bacterium]
MAKVKAFATRVEPLTVYREGVSVWDEPFPVTVYEDGEIALAGKTALALEERHKHYSELAERGELPEPTALLEREPEEPSPWPPRIIETRLEPVTVHEDGDRVWEEEFPAVVYSDGHVTFEIAVVDEIEARRAHFVELAERGKLPAPTGRSRPRPDPPKAPCVVATRTQPVPVYQEGARLWQEEFPVVVYDNGEVALEDAVLRKWEARQKHYLKLAERGELPEPSEASGKGSHEAAGG